jgi:hypothetical protein
MIRTQFPLQLATIHKRITIHYIHGPTFDHLKFDLMGVTEHDSNISNIVQSLMIKKNVCTYYLHELTK